MNPPDEIRIASLELRAHVGVPAAERKKAQRLTVSLTMVPVHEFGAMDDDVARTIVSAAVAKAIRALAAERPRKLIETLAEEIAQLVLDDFAAAVFSSACSTGGATDSASTASGQGRPSPGRAAKTQFELQASWCPPLSCLLTKF